MVLTRSDGERDEVDLEATGRRLVESEPAAMPEPLAPTVIATPSMEADDLAAAAPEREP